VIGAEDDTGHYLMPASTVAPEVTPLAEARNCRSASCGSVALAITSARLIPAAGLHVW